MDGATRNPLSSPSAIEPASGLAPEGLQSGVGLLPCPFCGNDGSGPIEDALHIVHAELHWRDSYDAYSVQCDKCTATMGYSDTEEEAVEAWNTRKALGKEAQ